MGWLDSLMLRLQAQPDQQENTFDEASVSCAALLVQMAAADFDQDRELAPWLYAIARRTTIDVIRREKRLEVSSTEQEVAVSSISFDRVWEVWEVRRAVDDLPDGEREVVRLCNLEGFTHEEVAERLGIPVGTVKSRSGRAYKRLAAALRHLDIFANQGAVSPVEGGGSI